VRVNRKYFVLGQFTRYIRQGFKIIDIDDPNSMAAYDDQTHRLVIVTLNSGIEKRVKYDLSRFTHIGSKFTGIATNIAPGHGVPDWKLRRDGPWTINEWKKRDSGRASIRIRYRLFSSMVCMSSTYSTRASAVQCSYSVAATSAAIRK
jgi:hypothetical protein